MNLLTKYNVTDEPDVLNKEAWYLTTERTFRAVLSVCFSSLFFGDVTGKSCFARSYMRLREKCKIEKIFISFLYSSLLVKIPPLLEFRRGAERHCSVCQKKAVTFLLTLSMPRPRWITLNETSLCLDWIYCNILFPRRPGFVPRSPHVESVVDKVALGKVFPRALKFFPVNIIPPMLHIHSCIIWLMNNGPITGLVPQQHILTPSQQ
jgi:hypothetical protein